MTQPTTRTSASRLNAEKFARLATEAEQLLAAVQGRHTEAHQRRFRLAEQAAERWLEASKCWNELGAMGSALSCAKRHAAADHLANTLRERLQRALLD